MIDGLFIKEDRQAGKYCIASDETMQPISVDMEYEEAVDFLKKMARNKQLANAIQPDAPRLYYNRWTPEFGKYK